jgi:hypothetical protein
MDHTAFYAYLRKKSSGVFGTRLSQPQVDGINGLLAAFDKVGDGKADSLAYILATVYHETGGRMVPVREGFATTDAGARRAVNNLAKKRGPKSAVARYAKPAGPYGHVYYGRGHPQLTWIDNYRESSDDAGVDLVKNPDAMLDPEISSRVLIRGMMDGRWNGTGARRTVNVQDHASTIAGYYKSFLNAINAGGGISAQPTTPPPIPKPPVEVKEEVTEPPVIVITAKPPAPAPREKLGFWARMKKLFGF